MKNANTTARVDDRMNNYAIILQELKYRERFRAPRWWE